MPERSAEAEAPRDHSPGTGRRARLGRIGETCHIYGKVPKVQAKQREEEGRRAARGRRKRAGRAWREGSHHPTDDRLHHKCVLEVADGVAVLGPTLVDSWGEKKEKTSPGQACNAREEPWDLARQVGGDPGGDTQKQHYKVEGAPRSSSYCAVMSLQ